MVVIIGCVFGMLSTGPCPLDVKHELIGCICPSQLGFKRVSVFVFSWADMLYSAVIPGLNECNRVRLRDFRRQQVSAGLVPKEHASGRNRVEMRHRTDPG